MDNNLERADYIALIGVFATLLGVFVTWLIMKRQYSSKKLAYSYDVEPILMSKEANFAQDLKVTYKGQELSNPLLISLNIANIGLAAVENVEVIFKLPNASYPIPGYFVDVPSGYAEQWDIESTDPGVCKIIFTHINPKQVSHIRLLIADNFEGDPEISCPMANVEFKRGNSLNLSMIAEILIQLTAPQLYASILKVR